MRRENRKKQRNMNILYISGIVLGLAVIAFSLPYLYFISHELYILPNFNTSSRFEEAQSYENAKRGLMTCSHSHS